MSGRYLVFMCFFLSSCLSVEASAQGQAVVSAQHLATDVGKRVLQRGGNAMDAAVAMGYALAVVHPCCGNLGGGGVMTVHLADGRETVIDFREQAPAALRASMLRGDRVSPYLWAGIPGSVAGMNEALTRYGHWPLARVIQPAVDLAEHGFRLVPGDIKILSMGLAKLKRSVEARRIWLPRGRLPKAGDNIKQPQLARTLHLLQREGTDIFYHGDLARRMVVASRRHGGVFQIKDFRRYRVHEREPLRCHYRGYEVVTAPPPFSGLTICQVFAILEDIDPNPVTDERPEGMLTQIGVLRRAYQDRAIYLADPDYQQVPLAKLLSRSHLKDMRERALAYAHGEVEVIPQNNTRSEGMHTTAYVVADRWGNVVSVTTTINSYFGSGIMPAGTGFFLNDEMSDFAYRDKDPHGVIVNGIEPGKRALSGMAPTLVTKHGQVEVALGSPGGGTIAAQIINTLLRMIDRHLAPEQVLAMPRFFPEWSKPVIHVEPGVFAPVVEQRLKLRGESLVEGMGFIPGIPSWGAVAIVSQLNHGLRAVMDPRRPAGSAWFEQNKQS